METGGSRKLSECHLLPPGCHCKLEFFQNSLGVLAPQAPTPPPPLPTPHTHTQELSQGLLLGSSGLALAIQM